MTPEQIEIYSKAAELGTIPDDMNPLFLFSTTHDHLLLRIFSGEFDPVALAKRELAMRGIELKLENDWPLQQGEKVSRQQHKAKMRKGKKL